MVDKNNKIPAYQLKSHWRKRLAQLMYRDKNEGVPTGVSVGKRLKPCGWKWGSHNAR